MSREPLADADALFAGLGSLSGGDALLIRRSYAESSPALRRCGWLLASSKSALLDVYLAPMRRWGASESFAPLREYERASRAAKILRMRDQIATPVAFWRQNRGAKPPRAWRAALWGLLIAGSPLALAGSLAAAWAPEILGLSFWYSLLGALCAPPILGEAERRALHAWMPMANLARVIVARWIAPAAGELALCAKAAEECRKLHGDMDAAMAGHVDWPALAIPSFWLARSGPLSAGALETAHGQALESLSALIFEMREAGRDPAVDAALSVLATQEREELAILAAPGAPRPRRAGSGASSRI